MSPTEYQNYHQPAYQGNHEQRQHKNSSMAKYMTMEVSGYPPAAGAYAPQWGMSSYSAVAPQSPYSNETMSHPPHDPNYRTNSGIPSPTAVHYGQHLTVAVSPAQPVFGSFLPKTPMSRQGKDSPVSSRNDSPNYYGNAEKRRIKNSENNTPRFPYVKIPEAIKNMGQPHPAFYLNSQGFPLRSGKPDCKHYISKGWCAYGTLCKFNHPESAATQSFTIVPAPIPASPGYIPAHWPGMVPATNYHWGPWAPQMGIHGPNPPMTPTYSVAANPGCYPCIYPPPHAIGSIGSVHSTLSNHNCEGSDRVSETESVINEN